jgi:hypothetical protein
MKIRMILTVAAITMFGAMANAQGHVRVFDGRGFATLTVGGVGSLQTAKLPLLDLVAGQPIRIRGGDLNGDGVDDIIVGATVNGHVKTTPIPCPNAPARSVRKSGDDKRQDYLTITMKEIVVSATDPSWKNTCRLLTVELRNGSKYVGLIKFRSAD